MSLCAYFFRGKKEDSAEDMRAAGRAMMFLVQNSIHLRTSYSNKYRHRFLSFFRLVGSPIRSFTGPEIILELCENWSMRKVKKREEYALDFLGSVTRKRGA